MLKCCLCPNEHKLNTERIQEDNNGQLFFTECWLKMSAGLRMSWSAEHFSENSWVHISPVAPVKNYLPTFLSSKTQPNVCLISSVAGHLEYPTHSVALCACRANMHILPTRVLISVKLSAYLSSCAMAAICSTLSWCAAKSLSKASCFRSNALISVSVAVS